MNYQVISVKDNKEHVECCKKTKREAEEVLGSIERVLLLSGWSIKQDHNGNKIWEVKEC